MVKYTSTKIAVKPRSRCTQFAVVFGLWKGCYFQGESVERLSRNALIVVICKVLSSSRIFGGKFKTSIRRQLDGNKWKRRDWNFVCSTKEWYISL
jgi:hypothetical protein